MSKVFDMASELRNNPHGEVDQKTRLTILEWEIRKMPVIEDSGAWSGLLPCIEEDKTLEVFQLALLVYLERASDNSVSQSAALRSRVNTAFRLLSKVRTFQRQFPLLILGSEARTDEDRIVVLDLISRTEKNSSARSLRSIKNTLQSLWAQDDLAQDRDPSYIDKFRAVLGSNQTLLSFI